MRLGDSLYLFVLMFMLPMDWFAPTGLALREFGAKPSIALMVCASLLILMNSPGFALRLRAQQAAILRPLALTLLAGSLAFFLNLIVGWSDFGRVKDPVVQFLAQTGIYAAFVLVVMAHGVYLRSEARREFAIRALVPVCAIYLAAVVADAAGLLSHTHGILSLFHQESSFGDFRPSGLSSEPSYFGALAGVYGTPLILGRAGRRRVVRLVLGILLFGTALAIHSKTFVPVVAFQFAVLFFRMKKGGTRNLYMLAGLVVTLASIYLIAVNSVFDIQENLSSANRFGSAILCLRASFAGYGLLGIGFGQFHFFYRPEFAPSFLLSSAEALTTMAPSASSRASAFNLYARLLLETGVVGLCAFALAVRRILSVSRKNWTPDAEFGTLITAGSLGFLMTQDPLFLPTLAFGFAFLLGVGDSQSSSPAPKATVI